MKDRAHLGQFVHVHAYKPESCESGATYREQYLLNRNYLKNDDMIQDTKCNGSRTYMRKYGRKYGIKISCYFV